MRQRRHILTAGIALATTAGFAVMVRQTGGGAIHAAASPNWTLLAAAFAISAAVQPLRALAWATTLRAPVSFRAIYAASSVGSFLDTVLPGRLGEASKVAVLRAAADERCPSATTAGAALLASLLLEGIAFAVVGAVSALFLPISQTMRVSLMVSAGAAVAGLVAMTLLHHRISHRLPRFARSFLAGGAAPWPVLLRAGGIMLSTWIVRCGALLLVLHAFSVHVGLGGALLYMVVTGLANTAPLLPGNAGVYQGAAMGALAMIGHAGAHALAVAVAAPVVGMVATAAAAACGLALHGRRFGELRRAALVRAPHAI